MSDREIVAEAHRGRTYRTPLDVPLDLKSRRHTGDDALPRQEANSYPLWRPRASRLSPSGRRVEGVEIRDGGDARHRGGMRHGVREADGAVVGLLKGADRHLRFHAPQKTRARPLVWP